MASVPAKAAKPSEFTPLGALLAAVAVPAAGAGGAAAVRATSARVTPDAPGFRR